MSMFQNLFCTEPILYCKYFILLLGLNMLAWVVGFVFVMYVALYIFRRIKNKEVKFLNRKLFIIFLASVIVIFLVSFFSLSGFRFH